MTLRIFEQMQSNIKSELYDVISGKSKVRFGAIIQTIASYLSESETTSTKVENTKQHKEQEAKKLEEYISKYNLWITDIDFTQYVSEGAEQKVYLNDSEHVLKLNDAIYYSSWREYLLSLLFHNYFFSDTAYELIGFAKEENVMYAVVKQSYVSITQTTNLNQVKEFLLANGFNNIRNNDYFNPELGIILEDLHDENVLTRNDVLYFIDTVFFITPDFWSEK